MTEGSGAGAAAAGRVTGLRCQPPPTLRNSSISWIMVRLFDHLYLFTDRDTTLPATAPGDDPLPRCVDQCLATMPALLPRHARPPQYSLCSDPTATGRLPTIPHRTRPVIVHRPTVVDLPLTVSPRHRPASPPVVAREMKACFAAPPTYAPPAPASLTLFSSSDARR